MLRVVLPKMAKHADGYHPLSYTVWFEYMRGGLPKLRRDIDSLLAKRERLTGVDTKKVFDEHLRDRSQKSVEDTRSELMTVLAKMMSEIDTAEDHTGNYQSVLETFDGALKRAGSTAELAELVSAVVASTAEVRGSLSSMNVELKANRAEVDRLTEELTRLREDVLTDPLTGLTNRRGFDVALEALKAAADGGGESFTLLMFDIDRFKKVNDTLGHLVGDKVIQHVANAMKACVRGDDTSARYGGEEFALLLPATTPEGARTVAEHVRNAIRRPQAAQSRSGSLPTVSVSVGIAGFRPGESKHEGRDRVTLAA
jgi:diguanylate cyclase